MQNNLQAPPQMTNQQAPPQMNQQAPPQMTNQQAPQMTNRQAPPQMTNQQAPLPVSFVPADSQDSARLCRAATHSSLNPLVQSQSNSCTCSVATLGTLLSLTERDAYQLMSSVLPLLTVPVGCDVDAPKIDPNTDSHWLPKLMNMTNFVQCVNCSGRAVAEACLGILEGSEDLSCCNERFRAGLRQLVDGAVVGLQFDRATAGQQGGGHWSPVLAYCEDADMVLVGDTAARYGHYWAPTSVICNAMRTQNRFQESRGWVIVRYVSS